MCIYIDRPLILQYSSLIIWISFFFSTNTHTKKYCKNRKCQKNETWEKWHPLLQQRHFWKMEILSFWARRWGTGAGPRTTCRRLPCARNRTRPSFPRSGSGFWGCFSLIFKRSCSGPSLLFCFLLSLSPLLPSIVTLEA